MAAVSDLIRSALVEIGVVPAGQAPGAGDSLDALLALNRLVSSWQTQRLQIYTTTRTTFAIASGTASYNVGPAQVVNVARPIYIDSVTYLDTSVTPNVELPLLPLTEDQRASLVQKTLTGSIPLSWYYNPIYPYGVLTLWPVPTGSTLTGVLYAPQAVAEFTGLAQAVSLPPGYERMLVKNLALELLPSYERPANPLLLKQASEAIAMVKAANVRDYDMLFDMGGPGRIFDIYIGE